MSFKVALSVLFSLAVVSCNTLHKSGSGLDKDTSSAKMGAVNLGANLDAVMAFNDPGMTDAAFEKKLVAEIVRDDVAMRTGTSDTSYAPYVTRLAQEAVDAAKKLYPNDRNRVISAAYDACSNSKPMDTFPKENSAFLAGSDYLAWAMPRASGPYVWEKDPKNAAYMAKRKNGQTNP